MDGGLIASASGLPSVVANTSPTDLISLVQNWLTATFQLGLALYTLYQLKKKGN